MKRKHAWTVLGLVAKIAITALVIAIPLLGIWTASSLAAFGGGSTGWAIGVGLIAFPVLPLLWDGIAQWRREKDAPRILKAWDRLVLRTFVVNLVFLGALLSFGPQALFTALSTRGDWMLDGREGETIASVRGALLETADGLEWLYDSFDEGNEFAELIEDDASGLPDSAPDSAPDPEPDSDADPAPDPDGRSWPFDDTPHAALASMPESEKVDLHRAARWLAAQESDPIGRAKLVHDFIALRVAYDAPSYVAGSYPPQDAETVFRTRLSVCAGYANLFHAMAQDAGLESRVVVGDTRKPDGNISGEGHAWNAVRIDSKWYLVDVTWDAGYVNGSEYTARYQTEYFMAPPEIFGLDHLPDEPQWQLRAQPIGRGEFTRQPLLDPGFFKHGFELIEPDRSQVTVQGRSVRLRVGNPQRHFMLANVKSKEGGDERRCTVSSGATIVIDCPLAAPGVYQVTLFGSDQQYGQSYWSVGGLEAVAR